MRTRIYLFFLFLTYYYCIYSFVFFCIWLFSSIYSYVVAAFRSERNFPPSLGAAEGMSGHFNSLLIPGPRMMAMMSLASPALSLWHTVVFPEFTFNLLKLYICAMALKYVLWGLECVQHEMDV